MRPGTSQTEAHFSLLTFLQFRDQMIFVLPDILSDNRVEQFNNFTFTAEKFMNLLQMRL